MYFYVSANSVTFIANGDLFQQLWSNSFPTFCFSFSHLGLTYTLKKISKTFVC